jgi:hypothetical protein
MRCEKVVNEQKTPHSEHRLLNWLETSNPGAVEKEKTPEGVFSF